MNRKDRDWYLHLWVDELALGDAADPKTMAIRAALEKMATKDCAERGYDGPLRFVYRRNNTEANFGDAEMVAFPEKTESLQPAEPVK